MPELREQPSTPVPPPWPVLYRLDVDGFVRAIESALTGEVAGYAMRLSERGRRSGRSSGTGPRSRNELLAVMGTFRRAGTVLSPFQAQTMLDSGFGIDWTVPTPLGTYYAKNGFWYDSTNQTEQGVLF